MIVKQVSLDIEVSDPNIDLETLIKSLLSNHGFNVLGSEQIDMSEEYNKYSH